MDSLNYTTASDSAVGNENQSDNSSSGSSLFKTQCVPCSPKRRQRNPVRKCVSSLESVQARDSSSDSSLEPRPMTLKAIFERIKKKKRRKRKYKPTGRPRRRPEGRKSTRSQINKKQFKDNRPQFPFLESENGRKPLPWRKILAFEQAVARGFFNYLEKLKYEYHLKESLKQMNVGEDLEKDDLDSRRYKYLDDDGSLSPIEDPVGEDEVETNLEHDECDIKLVVYPDGAFSVDLHRWKRLIEFLCISKICTILDSDNLGLIYEPTHVYRASEIEKPGRSIYSDPNSGPKVNSLRKLGPNNYRWGVFEICPYASGDQRSTKRIMELRCKLMRNQGLRTCEIP